MRVDYYNVLEVSMNATEDDLKKSYRRLALKWHPDKNGVDNAEATFRFKQISEAYYVLSDPQRRRVYEDSQRSESGNFPLQRSNWSNNKDIFKQYSTGFKESLDKAAKMVTKLPCTLEELHMGSERKVEISKFVLDHNKKRIKVAEALSITIKPGWKNGTKIIFPGAGNHEADYAPGDLIFVVDEEPHSVFRRKGNDLFIKLKISLLDALTDKILHIKTLDGRDLTVSVLDILRTGYEKVIRNEGMPVPKQKGNKGDLRIKLKFPSTVTDEQISHLRRSFCWTTL